MRIKESDIICQKMFEFREKNKENFDFYRTFSYLFLEIIWGQIRFIEFFLLTSPKVTKKYIGQ